VTIFDVPRETLQKLDELRSMVIAENHVQNLISSSTIPTFDERHIRDSLQLAPFLTDGPLLDIGSGGGFPGLVLACVHASPVHLVEPRTKRATFLRHVAERLGLAHVVVHASKVERVNVAPVSNITARAVARLSSLFEMAASVSGKSTRWILPKGRAAASELEDAQRTWQGSFRLVPSETDAEAAIVIAEGVQRRRAR
jgi:16S rRNA (guanine527-N7)-methyltransferase